MASSAMFKLFCVGMMALLVLAPHAEAAVSCGTTLNKLSPCLDYFTGNSGITTGCCSGVNSLLGLANTMLDRQSICDCLKNLAAANPSYVSKAEGILSTCGVSLPYTLSPDIDCSKVT